MGKWIHSFGMGEPELHDVGDLLKRGEDGAFGSAATEGGDTSGRAEQLASALTRWREAEQLARRRFPLYFVHGGGRLFGRLGFGA